MPRIRRSVQEAIGGAPSLGGEFDGLGLRQKAGTEVELEGAAELLDAPLGEIERTDGGGRRGAGSDEAGAMVCDVDAVEAAVGGREIDQPPSP